MKFAFIKKRKRFCSNFHNLVWKALFKLENEPLSKRLAATKCPVNSNREQLCDIMILHTSFKIKDVSSSMLEDLGLLPEAPHS